MEKITNNIIKVTYLGLIEAYANEYISDGTYSSDSDVFVTLKDGDVLITDYRGKLDDMVDNEILIEKDIMFTIERAG